MRVMAAPLAAYLAALVAAPRCPDLDAAPPHEMSRPGQRGRGQRPRCSSRVYTYVLAAHASEGTVGARGQPRATLLGGARSATNSNNPVSAPQTAKRCFPAMRASRARSGRSGAPPAPDKCRRLPMVAHGAI